MRAHDDLTNMSCQSWRIDPVPRLPTGWRPGVFSNLPHSPAPSPRPSAQASQWEEEEGGGLLAVHAAMRTSAAPVFFPIHQGFCDGGLLSSDPALMAYSKVG
jgi:hypothetical protein